MRGRGPLGGCVSRSETRQIEPGVQAAVFCSAKHSHTSGGRGTVIPFDSHVIATIQTPQDHDRPCGVFRARVKIQLLMPKPEPNTIAAEALALHAPPSSIDLSAIGITVKDIRRNLAPAMLYAEAIREDDKCDISDTGALIAYSGSKTGRSPKDKRIVKHPDSENDAAFDRTRPMGSPMKMVSPATAPSRTVCQVLTESESPCPRSRLPCSRERPNGTQ